MTGHTHHNATMVINDRVIEHNTAAVCETWWWSSYFSDRAVCVDGSPAGYGIYTVNATDVKWSYKGIGEPAGYQFRTYDMNTVKKHLDNNVYKSYLKQYSSRRNDGDDYRDGGRERGVCQRLELRSRVDGRGEGERRAAAGDARLRPRPLHTITFDIPRVEAKYEANSDWASCCSSHMFSATASSASSELEITVTDRFGNVYSERMQRPKAYVKSMK